MISGLRRLYYFANRLVLNCLSPHIWRSDNRAYWQNLHNKYIGKRGFVICNGPSLKLEDLDFLKDEITVGSNKIYLAFDSTDWRPTFYTVTDQLVANKISPIVYQYISVVHAPVNIGVKFPGCEEHFWKALRAPKQEPSRHILFSDDILGGLHGGYSITYQNLQLAVYLGLNPIYLLGCDHNYRSETDGDRRKIGAIEVQDASNHFIKGYREKGEVVNAAPIDRMNIAFLHARAYANKRGVRIFNATRGGCLEIFERVEFNQLFEPPIA